MSNPYETSQSADREPVDTSLSAHVTPQPVTSAVPALPMSSHTETSDTPAYDAVPAYPTPPVYPVPATATYPILAPSVSATNSPLSPSPLSRLSPIALILLTLLTVAAIAVFSIVGYRAVTPTKTAGVAYVNGANTTLTLPATVSDLQQTVVAVIHNVQPSIVKVQSFGGTGSGIGTGEFITADGYIITNNHVIAGFATYTVTLADGSVHAATVAGTAANDDLALLKTDVKNATPITFADSSQSAVGQFVIALGSPLGLDQSASFGIISSTSRAEQESGSSNGFAASSAGPVLTGLIQTSAPINPGNSGGALVDLQGHLVGIPTLGASTTASGTAVTGIGFAISSNRAKVVSDQLLKNGKLITSGQGFLGISGQDLSGQAQQGVAVKGFTADARNATPAQSANIQVNDIITAVNGRAITSSTDLANAVFTQQPGTVVAITLLRGTNTVTVQVTLGERPIA